MKVNWEPADSPTALDVALPYINPSGRDDHNHDPTHKQTEENDMRNLTLSEIHQVSGGASAGDPIEEIVVTADAPKSGGVLPPGSIVGVSGSTSAQEYWKERGREAVQISSGIAGQVACGKICGGLAALGSGLLFDLMTNPAARFPATGLPGTHPE